MKTWVVIVLVLAVAAAVRLPRLSSPREVVFDEVHFGKFVTAYCCTGERFFDIHPPHAKLLIAGTAKMLGYSGNFDFDHIGQPYGDVSPTALRLFSALMGIALPLVFYAWLRQLGVTPNISLLGGLAVALDNAMVVQTRLIALDGLLLVATFGALWAYGRKNYVLAGALAGLAAGTKFTGLAVLALLGVLVLVRLFKTPSVSPLSGGASHSSLSSSPDKGRLGGVLISGLVILLSAAIVYLGGWWLHFALLPNPGPGDAWGVPTGNFWQDTVKLHKTMLSANYHLTVTHPDESPAWSWPLMTTAIFYWSGEGGEVIYFLGNPVVWWGSTVLFVVAIVSSAWRRFQKPPLSPLSGGNRNSSPDKGRMGVVWIPLLGLLIAYLPLLRVPRALFLYHYLTPLLFVLAFGLMWLDAQAQSEKRKAQIMGVGAALLIVFFVLFSPLTYGLDVPAGWRQTLYWLPGWR